MLPLFRAHRIRWAQVARTGPRQGDGITVLADTRQPTTVHLGGAYRLSQELTAAGTLPQAGGTRRCSLKAKGWPLDQFITAANGGRPYRHAVGFHTGERSRAQRDARYNTPARTGWYPLIEWGWGQRSCEDYIHATLDTPWAKPACTYCPYALLSRTGRTRVLDAYRHDPAAAVAGLVMEHLAVSLNPRQGLADGQRLAHLLDATPGHEPDLTAFRAELDRRPWRLYEVRRAILPRPGHPAKPGRANRWLRPPGREPGAGDR